MGVPQLKNLKPSQNGKETISEAEKERLLNTYFPKHMRIVETNDNKEIVFPSILYSVFLNTICMFLDYFIDTKILGNDELSILDWTKGEKFYGFWIKAGITFGVLIVLNGMVMKGMQYWWGKGMAFVAGIVAGGNLFRTFYLQLDFSRIPGSATIWIMMTIHLPLFQALFVWLSGIFLWFLYANKIW